MHIPPHVDGVSFLIISDTHDSSMPRLNKHVDVLLHCGDLTQNGGLDAHRRAVREIEKFDAELKLVIPGNHDIDLDPLFQDSYERLTGQATDAAGPSNASEPSHDENVSKVGFGNAIDKPTPDMEGSGHAASEESFGSRSVWLSRSTRESKIHLLHEGSHRFTLKSGASFLVYASPITPTSGLWAFQRPSGEDRFNSSGSPPWARNVSTSSSVIPGNVDIIMTHGPPKYILDEVDKGGSAGCEHLARAVCRVQPLFHAFGHIHSARGIRRVLWRNETEQGSLRERHSQSGARKRKHSQLEPGSDEGEEPAYSMLPQEFIGQNSSRRAGFSRLRSVNLGERGRKTLFVNAAVGNVDGQAGDVPFLVEICGQAETERERP